jgi:methylglyoxal synthase
MKDRIAFIAHNNKKAQMVSFVMKNHKLIDTLGLKVITTGSTGDRLEESGIEVFKKYKSGALGGDIEIGSRVCEGKVAMVFFFIDPLSAHAHDTDIGALIRVCNVHNVPFALNTTTAELCLKGLLVEKEREINNPEYLTKSLVQVKTV